jgi:hypothetical protein
MIEFIMDVTSPYIYIYIYIYIKLYRAEQRPPVVRPFDSFLAFYGT